MKAEILTTLIGCVVSALVGIFCYKYLTRDDAPNPNANPFKKVGVLATQNGVVAEVFDLDGCYVLVQSVPGEHGRAIVQMECK